MYQFLKNLISNSLKYLNTGEPAKVLLAVGVFGNQQYLIFIIDAGLGLDEKH
jgi:signal transduction histidine kinase